MKKEYIILVLVIALLSVYIIFQKTDKTHYTLPDIAKIDKDDITQLSVKTGDKELVLQREEDQWLILPEKYPADTGAVDNMLDIISAPVLTAMASESKNYSIYDLDEGKRIEAAISKDDTLLRKLEIGKTASSYRHTFVKLDNDSRIYHAEQNFRGHFEKDVSTLRDKQVMKIEEDISEIILTSGEKNMHITRGVAPVDVNLTEDNTAENEEAPPPETPKWMTKDGRAVKEKEIDTIIKTLSNLKCDEYIDGKKKEDYQKPSFTISLKGAKNYALSLYDKQDNKLIGTSSENSYPFLVAEWKAKKINLNPDELLEQ